MELNGGRFYARKLTSDNRIDDVPALSLILADAAQFIADATTAWHEDTEYTWAICEQTSVELLALARLDPKQRTLEVVPAGDPATQLGPSGFGVHHRTWASGVDPKINEPFVRVKV